MPRELVHCKSYNARQRGWKDGRRRFPRECHLGFGPGEHLSVSRKSECQGRRDIRPCGVDGLRLCQ